MPLRTDEWPDGLPELAGHDKARVVAANQLYDFVAAAIVKLTGLNVRWTVENPTNSLMWKTSFFVGLREFLKDGLHIINFQMCMHGGTRNKRTTIWAGSAFDWSSLALMCEGNHTHASWAQANCDYATAEE